jgi:hypothetical protein
MSFPVKDVLLESTAPTTTPISPANEPPTSLFLYWRDAVPPPLVGVQMPSLLTEPADDAGRISMRLATPLDETPVLPAGILRRALEDDDDGNEGVSIPPPTPPDDKLLPLPLAGVKTPSLLPAAVQKDDDDGIFRVRRPTTPLDEIPAPPAAPSRTSTQPQPPSLRSVRLERQHGQQSLRIPVEPKASYAGLNQL